MQTDSAPVQPRVVSVHSLVEFVLQVGDITAGGFQKRDRAQAGTHLRGQSWKFFSAILFLLTQIGFGKLARGK